MELINSIPCRLHTGKIPFDAIPQGWIVFNAPRPLLGELQGRGEFLSGVFYAAVNPETEEGKRMIEENKKLDAVIVIQADQDELEHIVLRLMPERYRQLWAKAKQQTRDSHVWHKAHEIFSSHTYQQLRMMLCGVFPEKQNG